MNNGFLSIILHAHLPYVRHPEYPHFFEENWLFEAMSDCYIPLVQLFENLDRDQIKFRLTLSLSPTLMAMLVDELLQTRYQQYLNQQIHLAEQEVIRTKYQPEYHKLARLYRRHFLAIKATYQSYQGDLLVAFKKYYDKGYLELITTAATHGFLPLMNPNEIAVRSQIKIGIQSFKSHFGFQPNGFWLPECGYYSGLERLLAEENIDYFFIDSHAILESSDFVQDGIYAPVSCHNGVLAFARDTDTAQQVWSAKYGYPNNTCYREYYSDIGFEVEHESERMNTGIKYHRISAEGQPKRCYDVKKARYQVEQDAVAFVNQCQHRFSHVEPTGKTPLIVSPYDAELFGHWWFEGIAWLEAVFRLIDEPAVHFMSISCSDYAKHPFNHQVLTPISSTWGEGGYSHYWLNNDNAWIYPFLHTMAIEMQQLVVDFKSVTVSTLQRRALNQALRSLLLAQASDWAFILKSGTTTTYAKKRITDYIARFNYLHECIRRNRIDEQYLFALEVMDALFEEVDYRNYD